MEGDKNVFYISVLSESPRWLIDHGRLVEAEKIFHRAAKLNGTTSNLPQDLSTLLSKIHSVRTPAHFHLY